MTAADGTTLADDTFDPADGAGDEVVEALSRALELHDYRRGLFGENEGHTARVTRLAMQFAERVAPDLAADPRLEYGFRLHDIGMIGVSDSILAKRGSLTQDELYEVREHPLLGERIATSVACLRGIARQVIGAHHERWNGSGYPRRLEGERIPLPARIFALADVYDAMTSEQPWRNAFAPEVALAEIERGSGVLFDPVLVPFFLELVGSEIVLSRSLA
jgi:HD-GYP domain-containing protein (c-di-GMP phosphodiesterase class II)